MKSLALFLSLASLASAATNSTSNSSSLTASKPAPLPQPNWTLLSDPTFFYLPNQTVFTAAVADLSQDAAVTDQWASGDAFINYAWDADRNCLQEVWYYMNETLIGSSVCRNKSVTIGTDGSC